MAIKKPFVTEIKQLAFNDKQKYLTRLNKQVDRELSFLKSLLERCLRELKAKVPHNVPTISKEALHKIKTGVIQERQIFINDYCLSFEDASQIAVMQELFNFETVFNKIIEEIEELYAEIETFKKAKKFNNVRLRKIKEINDLMSSNAHLLSNRDLSLLIN